MLRYGDNDDDRKCWWWQRDGWEMLVFIVASHQFQKIIFCNLCDFWSNRKRVRVRGNGYSSEFSNQKRSKMRRTQNQRPENLLAIFIVIAQTLTSPHYCYYSMNIRQYRLSTVDSQCHWVNRCCENFFVCHELASSMKCVVVFDFLLLSFSPKLVRMKGIKCNKIDVGIAFGLANWWFSPSANRLRSRESRDAFPQSQNYDLHSVIFPLSHLVGRHRADAHTVFAPRISFTIYSWRDVCVCALDIQFCWQNHIRFTIGHCVAATNTSMRLKRNSLESIATNKEMAFIWKSLTKKSSSICVEFIRCRVLFVRFHMPSTNYSNCKISVDITIFWTVFAHTNHLSQSLFRQRTRSFCRKFELLRCRCRCSEYHFTLNFDAQATIESADWSHANETTVSVGMHT